MQRYVKIKKPYNDEKRKEVTIPFKPNVSSDEDNKIKQ
jgi:hypothetical protein